MKRSALARGIAALAIAWAGCAVQPGTQSGATGDTTAPGSGGLGALSPFLALLESTEPKDDASAADLAVLASWLGEARVVGLGEHLHGVHDFHRLAHRIFAYLARAEDFDVFALEIDQAHAARLNEFVHSQRDDLEALLAERWWAAIFYDVALRDLLLWMREYNQTAGHPLSVAGFDLKQPSLAMQAVVEGLQRLDPLAAKEVDALYEPLLELGGFGIFPNVYGFSGVLTVALPPRTGTQLLRIGLEARGQGVSHGRVGLSVEGAGSGSRSVQRSRFLTADELSPAWMELDVEVQVPAEVSEVQLEIFHRGNGAAWFDGLVVELGGERLEPADGLDAIQPRPLLMPALQVMDYTSRFDQDITYDGGRSLRVECNPAVDDALRAVRRADALVRELATKHQDRLSHSEAVWLERMSRLVVQACEWRTLVEVNRDLFMAENLTWLLEEGFPGSRVLALAHASHTDRIPKRMGQFLSAGYGERYKTVSMLTLSGRYVYFGDSRTTTPGARLEEFAVEPDAIAPLARRLGALASGDLLFHRAGAAASDAGRSWLQSAAALEGEGTDVVILLREVGPLVLP